MAMLLKLMLLPLLFIQIGVAESIISDSSLNSKISLLVSSIDEKTSELRKKDKRIKELESTVDLQLAKLASLQTEFQEKGSLNARELVAKPNVCATQLECQIDVLRRKLETQIKKKEALGTRTNVADEKIQELNLKLESLLRINEELNAMICKTKRAVQVAEEEMMKAKLEVSSVSKQLEEEEMMKAKLEASSVSKQLEEVKEGWLPPWLAVHFQYEGALETKSEAVKLVETHIHSFKTKWIPAMKERSVEFARDAGSQIQRFKTKTTDLYHTSKQYMEPHIVKAQEARKFTDFYVDQVPVVMKSHIDKARILFQPYTDKVPHHYRNVKKIVCLYHHQALPEIFLNLALEFMCAKPKKHSRKHHTSHTRRRAKRAKRAKRAHPDK